MACPRCGCKTAYQFNDDDDPQDDRLQRCAACGEVFDIDDHAEEDDDDWWQEQPAGGSGTGNDFGLASTGGSAGTQLPGAKPVGADEPAHREQPARGLCQSPREGKGGLQVEASPAKEGEALRHNVPLSGPHRLHGEAEA